MPPPPSSYTLHPGGPDRERLEHEGVEAHRPADHTVTAIPGEGGGGHESIGPQVGIG